RRLLGRALRGLLRHRADARRAGEQVRRRFGRARGRRAEQGERHERRDERAAGCAGSHRYSFRRTFIPAAAATAPATPSTSAIHAATRVVVAADPSRSTAAVLVASTSACAASEKAVKAAPAEASAGDVAASTASSPVP